MIRDVVIRRHRAGDDEAVADLIAAAFAADDGPTPPVEVALNRELHADGDVIEELTMVAEHGGQVVGQVTCSRGSMQGRAAIGLGPIAVAPAYQGRGIGGALLASVIATAEGRGDPVIVLLGDPGYYGAYGFVPAASTHGIMPPQPWGDAYFQAKTLRAWRPEMAGAFRYAPAFDRVPEA